VAIVAVPFPDEIVGTLLRARVHVLCEHPVSSSLARRAARNKRAVFDVNGHFSDLPAARSFVRSCRAAGQARFASIVVHPRTVFSALELLALAVPVSPLHVVRALHDAATGTASAHARLPGFPLVVVQTPQISKEDDGSDIVLGHHLSVAFGERTLTLVDTFGPVVRTRFGSSRVVSTSFARVSSERQREDANVSALRRFVRAVEGATDDDVLTLRRKQLTWVADTTERVRRAWLAAPR
jgi:NAD-dependent oxidoreductase involved in siderophore biosynthesis